ncbi:MAG: phosphohistidine phosphatase SixA [Candidatus Aureabacteria bacterium]|nr:phosphohistidine phosphatase SixA [Candidatus Auribacterota bacterium]
MKLYLVQHGDAKPKEEDPERPLSAKGLADVARVADFLRSGAGITVSSIMHSGKLRARQTAELLATRLDSPSGAAQDDGLDPLAESDAWAERLNAMDEDIMLVGHLPHLSSLAARLLCGDEGKKIVSFTTGSVLCLEGDAAGGWAVRWMVTPELIG